MEIAYFDCFAGASGDMILGALVDAGLELGILKSELAKIPLNSYSLTAKRVEKRGIQGTKVTVTVDQGCHRHPQRSLFDIQEMIHGSSLTSEVKQRSNEVFKRLADAEARAHGLSVQQVHFHEVGAVDAIVDVIGSVVGLSLLGVKSIYCSPLHLGAGVVECDHGMLPVPAPATAELIKGKPVFSTGIQGELLTPTGAAIITTLATSFGHMPYMKPSRVGYGAGTRDLPIPNLLRILIGEGIDKSLIPESDCIAVLTTNIDDMNPQIYDYVMQGLFQRGALDVFLAPIQMKKNRPGSLVTVLCQPEHVQLLSEFLMRETTTIGLRWHLEQRIKALRSVIAVRTKFGEVRIKIIRSFEESPHITPEYDDCRLIAQQTGLPLKEVLEEVRRAGMSQISP